MGDRENIKQKKNKRSSMKGVVVEFEGRLSMEVRRHEKLDMVEERNFRKGELLENYMVKMLYR